MQKVRLLVFNTDVDVALDIVQRAGALEFHSTDIEEGAEPELTFPNAQLYPRVQHAIQFLNFYEPEVSLWKTLREGTRTQLTEAEISRYLSDTDAVSSIVDDLEEIQVEFAEKNEKERLLQEKYDVLEEWKNVPIKLSNLETKLTVTLLVKSFSATKENPVLKQVGDLCDENKIPCQITPVTEEYVAVTIEKEGDSISRLTSLLGEQSIEILTPPEGEETPDVEFVAISEALAKIKGEVALLHDQAEHFAKMHLNRLRLSSEVLKWQKDRFAVVNDAKSTQYTVVFDGWIKEESRAKIEAEFNEKEIAAVFSKLPLEDGEEPPVEIENSNLIEPFEAVTRLYGLPGYKDLDPTVFLAGFFFLFFGLSLTDVGYGLALVVASIFILTVCKVTKATRSFAKLLLFIGMATVLVGMLFGGYLGLDPSFLPESIQSLQKFDPIGNPLPVFYLALSLGVVQIMFGMVLKIYSDARNGQLVNGILDQGPWLSMFCIGILYILTSIGFVCIIPVEKISNLAIVSTVLILLASGRKGENILQKIISAVAGLYEGVSYFSDILSYSRLLALGLATSALAFAINLIAEMVSGVPYVGIILSAVVLFIGHVFTLAINTLGAFVHSARLQFVEFFGKFITGTGKEFSPLSRKERYITIDDD